MKTLIVTPWFNPVQRDKFLSAWEIKADDPRVVLQQDTDKSGCGVTKNRGVKEAMFRGADLTIVIDDDVLPSDECESIEQLIETHIKAHEPQEFPLLEETTKPQARGVPYFKKTVKLPVAVACGWWKVMPDRDAARQLVEGVASPMDFDRKIVYGRPTVLCGMHISFNPSKWAPWSDFFPVSRMDDIFFSWIFCKEIARRHHCINFNLPALTHSRQSDVFSSLIDEAKWLRFNEDIWHQVWLHESNDYKTLRALFPV